MRACLWLGGLAAAALLAVFGRGWPGLIAGAIATPTSAQDAATNVALHDGIAYAARSARGLEAIDATRGTRRTWRPVAPADRVDDVAIADGLLFALDATPPGYLTVYRLDGDGAVHVLQPPTPVPVGPFSGVAAAAGHVIVSGGTSSLTLRRYAAEGALSAPALADFGRGQPDVALVDGGRLALVSTHVQGPRFGLTVADVVDAPLALRTRGYVELPGAGFTEGGFHPANFALQAAWLDNVALVAHGGGLSVVATPADATPRLLRTLALPVHATAIAVDATTHRLFVTGLAPAPTLLEFDVADARAPRLIGRRALPDSGTPSALALDATHLAIARQGGGVHLEARPSPSLAFVPPTPETPR
jgi:hypothetical protein